MKKTIILILLFGSMGLAGKAQTTDSVIMNVPITATTNYFPISISNSMAKEDTIEVLGYVLTDFKRKIFQWIQLYAICSFNKPSVSLPAIRGAIYSEYLLSDRKTKSSYRVIFALNK